MKNKTVLIRIITAAVVIGIAVLLGQWVVPAAMKAMFL